jgi:carbonic anhydrase
MSFDKLVEGFRSFQSDHFTGDSELYQKLIMEGQSPEALIIACSDSRIDPGIVTKADAGDIFSVRNIAALVPPYAAPDRKEHSTSAAIEYAVGALKVQYIIVMGHALCGGIRALAESEGDLKSRKDFVSRWISLGSKARDMVRKALPDAGIEEQARVLEQASILVSLKNLMTFPSVKKAVEEGRLQLHGWYFDIPNGKILGYDNATRKFKNILTNIEPAVMACEHGCDCHQDISIGKFLQRVKKEKKLTAYTPIDTASGAAPNVVARIHHKQKMIEHMKQLLYAATATTAMAAIAGGLDEILSTFSTAF